MGYGLGIKEEKGRGKKGSVLPLSLISCVPLFPARRQAGKPLSPNSQIPLFLF
jgi:hypothetical protein